MLVHTPVNLSSEPVARRSPDKVMRLARLGCAHPTRLSFLRILLRRMKEERWRFDRPVWDVNSSGVGVGVYRAIGPSRTYSLVAFAHDLPDEMRSDRVIATAWDATFTLFDGDFGIGQYRCIAAAERLGLDGKRGLANRYDQRAVGHGSGRDSHVGANHHGAGARVHDYASGGITGLDFEAFQFRYEGDAR